MSAGLGVLVADDDALARRMICADLERLDHVALVTGAGDEVEAIDLARHPEIGLVVLEPRIAVGRIEHCVRALRSRSDPPDVVLFTADSGPHTTIEAVRAGCCGVVEKEEGVTALRDAIEQVTSGSVVLPGTLVMALVELVRAAPEAGIGLRPVVSGLTAREWEILDLMSTGSSTQVIADELVLSVHTVYSHIKNIMRKLGVHDRDDAVRAACTEPAAAVVLVDATE